MMPRLLSSLLLAALVATAPPLAAASDSLNVNVLPTIVVEAPPPPGAFTVFDATRTAPIITDPADFVGVNTAGLRPTYLGPPASLRLPVNSAD